MTTLLPAEVPTLVPAGTAVVAPPRRRLITCVAGRLGSAALTVAVTAVAVFWFLPTFGLFVASLRSSADSASTGWWTVFRSPGQLTVANYAHVLRADDFLHSLLNSVLITVSATVLVVAFASGAAYALAWMHFRGREWTLVGLVALIIVPVQLAILPDAQTFRYLRIYGDISAVVAFHVAFGLPFGIFLLHNFFRSIPRGLLEAARMDGASDWRIFRLVVLPIGWPAVVSLAIYEFLWVWNDLLVALVFATSDHAPITYTLASQMRSFSTNLDVIGPGAFLSMVVPLGVFFAFQRYVVQGVLAGSVK